MSVLDHRRRSATAHAVPTSPSPSPSPSFSPFFQRTRGVSPTQRASSRRHSSRTVADSTPPLRHSSSRKISRNNPPHVNNDIAKSQFASMNPRPHTPIHPEFDASSTTLVNPTSSILQGLIKEQRATRNSRRTPQLPEDVDRRPTTSGSQSQSHENSPSEKQRRTNSAILSGLKQPRDMGIREMDQYVSKMNKLNFDLKLEIFHRTQQIATLEKKMERMHEMEEELARMRGLEDELDELREVEENNQRLRDANEHLQTELDRRDQAISEAVELICHLEAKVEELQANCESVRTFGDGATVVLDNSSEMCTPKAQSFFDIPDRTSSKKGTVRRPRKSPSFMREEDRSTAALRSLFLADENKSCRSVSQSTIGTTVDSTGDPPSPRLSILSECSYFNPQDIQQPPSNEFDHLESLDRLKLAESDSLAVTTVRTTAVSPSHHLSDQISDWMHYNEITPRSSRGGKNRRVRAFSDVSRSSHAPIAQLDEPFQVTRKTRQRQYPSPRQQNLSDFGGQLPPTPDTMSTSRPVLRNGSNVNLAKDPGHFGSREMLTTLSRPRSLDELTTRSTSLSTRSDGIETTASVDTRYNVRDVPQNLLSSFSHYARGSAKATRVLGPGSPSNPRLSCYGGDLLFNGEGVENITFDAPASRVSSLNFSTAAHQLSKELPTSSTLTPQEWLEAARTKNDVNALKEKNSTLEVKEKISVVLRQGNANQNNVEDTKVDADETVGDNTSSPRNPPLRLHAWADEAQSASETPQPRRRLSLRPRFFSRNRHQTPETQADAVATVPKGPYSTPDKSLALLVSKHRRTSSGPGLNVGENTTPLGQTAVRPLPKPLSDLRPSTASRPMTSDSAEPRSKGSLFLGWMKGSHNKETESSPTAHLGVARSITDRPKSTASIDVSSLILGQEGDRAPVDDEPVWRARRRSRRMV